MLLFSACPDRCAECALRSNTDDEMVCSLCNNGTLMDEQRDNECVGQYLYAAHNHAEDISRHL